jgi:1-deoxy-D-xylulose-5-phosphate reductoisomerase
MPSIACQWVTVLGATGSIGCSTLDVLARHPERFRVFALTAHRQIEKLAQQCWQCQPVCVVVHDELAAQDLQERLQGHPEPPEILVGAQGLDAVVTDGRVTTVVAAIVGAAGLRPTLAAVRAGKRILLANKESLVMAGGLFMSAVRRHSALLLPVDSEHNAIFQCLPPECADLTAAGVRRLLLTGSGGPFRTLPVAQLPFVTPEQACCHPNWSMGKKISVDSATMMNKGLEYIEACWLFGASPEQIRVLLHPQSIVHSMVEYCDGSVLAQMGQPDMRTPIANCLSWPERIVSGAPHLDFLQLGALEFAEPDLQRFPSLALAQAAMQDGGTAPAALNAANEVAVEAFLDTRLGFTQIPQVVEQVMQSWNNHEPEDLDAVYAADQLARGMAVQQLQRLAEQRGAR